MMVGKLSLLALGCLAACGFSSAQQTPSTSVVPAPQEEEEPYIPGDWAPALLDAILSSPSPDAREALLDAAFAAGPPIVPHLAAALKDDRTAEFAAQSLAYIGGDQALAILSKLVKDPRDLNLRRFLYGALGEFQSPEATRGLLDALARADKEPDRTVTEAAILALTVRSDASLLPPLRQTEAKIKDVVIHDDLENAIEVIETRARYLASPEGKKEGVSVERAVRTYFYPALEPSPTAEETSKPKLKDAKPAKSTPVKSTAIKPAPPKPAVTLEIQSLTFSPDKSRALAHVVFEDPTALANYDMVLQKQYGDWTIASVWLGAEAEKSQPETRVTSSPKR